VYRRYACDLPTNSLDKIFLQFSKSLDKKNYVESFNRVLAAFDSIRRFPSDAELYEKLQLKELYSSSQISKCKYALSKLEKDGWKEHVRLDNLTIEHVMPQTLSTEWQEYLGERFEEIHRTWLNRLGNLTLSGYNSEYQNYSFLTKRDMEGGYRESAVHLNQSLAKEDIWNESTMKARGEGLAAKAVKVWRMHNVPSNEVVAIRKELKNPKSYTFDDYPNFTEGSNSRALFDLLYKELSYANVMCLKYYIALKYKDTNLVSITPSGTGLKCWLSLDFEDLRDTNNFKNVRTIGHWGTGNVEYYLSTQNQLPALLKEIEQVKEKIDQQASSNKKLTPFRIAQQEYWNEFRTFCIDAKFSMNPAAILRPAKPYADYGFQTEIPHTVSYVTKNHDKKTIGCGIIFYQKTHNLFETALRNKAEVEQILGYQSMISRITSICMYQLSVISLIVTKKKSLSGTFPL
jgi:predicted transport protein